MKTAFFKFKNLILNQNFLIILILVLAAFLRLYRIADYMTFLGDQGRDVLIAYGILHGKFTLLGPTSSVGGFFLGPIYYYFMAPFLWLFNYDPVGPSVMIALIGVATVWLTYKFASELFNNKVGIIAAIIYAISPIIVADSRFSWNPNPLPFISLLILYILYLNTYKNKLIYFFFTGFLLGIAMQLHYLATFLAVIIFVYLLLSEFILRKTKFLERVWNLIKKNIIIFLGFLFGWSPFLAFELRHGFPDFIHIFDFILHSGNTGANSNFFQITYDVFFRLFARLVFAFPDINQISKFTKLEINLWITASLILALLSILLLFIKLIKTFRKKSPEVYKYLLLTVWITMGVLLFGLYKKAIYEYYFAFMFPLPFILVANLLVELGVLKKSKVMLIISSVIFLGIFLINIQGVPFRYEPNRQLNQMRSIADFVMTKTNAKPFNFALISTGNTDHAYRYFFTIWNHPPRVIEDNAHDPKRLTVTDQLFVVCESPLPCQPLGNSLWEIAGFGRAEIAGHWNVSVVEVYKLVHYKEKNGTATVSKSK